MSQFEEGLRQASARQVRIFWIAGGICLGVVLAVALGFVFADGVEIRVSPPDAGHNAEIRVKQGIGLVIGSSAYRIGDEVEIEVSADGFQSVTQPLAGDEVAHVLEVRLSPLPARVGIMTEPEVGGLLWSVDGELSALGGPLEIELPAGSHQVTARHPFFQDFALDLVLARGEQFSELARLEPVEGVLDVTSVPSGATVRLS